MPEALELMLFISNPDDFPAWPPERKLDRYERVAEWHDFIAGLHRSGSAPHVWGSHQLLSRARFTTSLGLLVVVLRVESWSEFDDLLLHDPLRDMSQYVTIPLEPLFDDRKADTARFERVRAELAAKRTPLGRLAFHNYRSLYRQPPEYVGKYEPVQPRNPITDIERTGAPDDPLEILILGVNPNELITLWDDTRKFIHYEKVQWWHDYTAMMIHQGKISHVWGTHDFCYINGPSGNSAAAVTIFTVKTYEEFDQVYKLDPIRDATMFWSVLLQPIADQRRQDLERLRIARGRRS